MFYDTTIVWHLDLFQEEMRFPHPTFPRSLHLLSSRLVPRTYVETTAKRVSSATIAVARTHLVYRELWCRVISRRRANARVNDFVFRGLVIPRNADDVSPASCRLINVCMDCTVAAAERRVCSPVSDIALIINSRTGSQLAGWIGRASRVAREIHWRT